MNIVAYVEVSRSKFISKSSEDVMCSAESSPGLLVACCLQDTEASLARSSLGVTCCVDVLDGVMDIPGLRVTDWGKIDLQNFQDIFLGYATKCRYAPAQLIPSQDTLKDAAVRPMAVIIAFILLGLNQCPHPPCTVAPPPHLSATLFPG